MAQAAPRNLGARGRKLWREIAADHTLDAQQKIMLEEACRTADRLERLDEALRGDESVWLRLLPSVDDDDDTEVARFDLVITGPLSEARQQQNILKQLLASLRLPDVATGQKPQQRGGARGSYAPRSATKAAKAAGDAGRVVSLAERFGS